MPDRFHIAMLLLGSPVDAKGVMRTRPHLARTRVLRPAQGSIISAAAYAVQDMYISLQYLEIQPSHPVYTRKEQWPRH